MKQALLFVLLVFGGLHCTGQKIRFTDTSNKWTFVDMNEDGLYHSGWIMSDRFGSDTLISSESYRRILVHVRGATSQLGLALREDTAAEKIYFRFLSASFLSNNSDTVEHIFFDYRMRLNDTLKMDYATHHTRYYVGHFDSLQIGVNIYKRWRMFPSGSLAGEYTFIEGIGCVAGIGYPVYLNYFFEDLVQLRCFRNSTGQPVCDRATELPHWNGYVDEGVYQTDSFDNVASCTIYPVAVQQLSSDNAIQIYPNPGGKNVVLKIPAGIKAAIIQIKDISGRTIKEITAKSGSNNIGQYLSAPGVYTYTLQDAATGQRYTGRFIFQ